MNRAERRREARTKRKGASAGMKHIKNELFIAVTGDTPFRITEQGEDGRVTRDEEATIGAMILLSLQLYERVDIRRFMIAKDRVLAPSEINSYNRVRDYLESDERAEGEWLGFEDTDYALAKKVLGWVGEVSPWFRNLPKIQDALGDTVDKIPETEESKEPETPNEG